jgi:hypothetical protein
MDQEAEKAGLRRGLERVMAVSIIHPFELTPRPSFEVEIGRDLPVSVLRIEQPSGR